MINFLEYGKRAGNKVEENAAPLVARVGEIDRLLPGS